MSETDGLRPLRTDLAAFIEARRALHSRRTEVDRLREERNAPTLRQSQDELTRLEEVLLPCLDRAGRRLRSEAPPGEPLLIWLGEQPACPVSTGQAIEARTDAQHGSYVDVRAVTPILPCHDRAGDLEEDDPDGEVEP